MRLSKKTDIPASATVEMNMLVSQKRQNKEKVYNLSVGEPLVQMDSVVVRGIEKAVSEGKTFYAPVAGVPELRVAVADSLNRKHDSSYVRDEVIITTGGKHAVMMALQSLLDDGDETVIISPYWVSYPSMVTMCGGVSRFVETTEENGWLADAEDIEWSIGPRTRVLILNNASNPTGAIYSHDQLRAILEVCVRHDVVVISDEVYSGLVYDDTQYISVAEFPEYKEKTIIIGSASKNFAMTGARLGYAVSTTSVIERMVVLQGQTTTGPATILQWAWADGFADEDRIVSSVRSELSTRRDAYLDVFEKCFGVRPVAPASALYSFVPISIFGVNKTDSVAFAMRVLYEANVAMVPGISFGMEGYVRLSFGGHMSDTREALETLAKYLLK